MDMYVGEVNSTVRTEDAGSAASPAMIEDIVREVLERLSAERAREERAEADRVLRPGVCGDED